VAGPGYLLDPGWRMMLLEHGVRPEDALRLAGLPEDLLGQASVRLSPDEHDRLVQASDDLVGDPLLALRIVEGLDRAIFSPPLFMGLCSPDLRVAATRLSRFKPVIAPFHLDLVDDGDLTIVLRPTSHLGRTAPLFMRLELLYFTQMARMGTRVRVEPARVRTPHVPDPLGPFEAFLGCGIEEGPHLAVTFREADARRPFLTANPALWAMFEPHLKQKLADLAASASVTERTRAVLLESLPAGISDVSSVARRLGISGRTLQRRLRDEGTSFKEVVRNLREELAHHYLHRTRHSASEIAYLIGFDQPSSFFRAFHEWTGSTPEAVRARGDARARP